MEQCPIDIHLPLASKYGALKLIGQVISWEEGGGGTLKHSAQSKLKCSSLQIKFD